MWFEERIQNNKTSERFSSGVRGWNGNKDAEFSYQLQDLRKRSSDWRVYSVHVPVMLLWTLVTFRRRVMHRNGSTAPDWVNDSKKKRTLFVSRHQIHLTVDDHQKTSQRTCSRAVFSISKIFRRRNVLLSDTIRCCRCRVCVLSNLDNQGS